MSAPAFLQFVDLEETAVEKRHPAKQLFQLGSSFRSLGGLAEPFMEQAQQEVAVEGVELVLARIF
ncbi:MAG: hypothetical protein KatS3mg082_3364 [Nitrospiraceae bacterium]|nr:MAG: hypothetical protein KatS3mg082_3364 [Nitrospiraceae bacterium]